MRIDELLLEILTDDETTRLLESLLFQRILHSHTYPGLSDLYPCPRDRNHPLCGLSLEMNGNERRGTSRRIHLIETIVNLFAIAFNPAKLVGNIFSTYNNG